MADRPRPTVLRGLPRSLCCAVLLLTAVACVPNPRVETPVASPTPAGPGGWLEHEIADGAVIVALPADWLVLDEAALADDGRRAELEADFAGARTLFGQLDAQGRGARLVLLGVDPRARDTGRFPVVVTVVAVEPALPALLLGLGADFAIDAFERTFELETDVTRTELETPVGEGIRLGFTHRIVGVEGGPGVAVEHDGAIVTTGAATFLVSRNVDPETSPADTPSLDAILATLHPAP